MEQLSRLLAQPEFVHVAINHFPLVGSFVAMLALAASLAARNRPALLLSLSLVSLLALSFWPVYHFGEAGYDRVLSMSDEAGGAYLKSHEALAERWAFLYYLTAGVAALGVGLAWKWPRALPVFSALALLLAVASLAAGIAIAHAGGQVRHREFRSLRVGRADQEFGKPALVQREGKLQFSRIARDRQPVNHL
jgi:hypothetical protein